jgi:lipopolysaccharide cholinephosphotransferase
MTSFTYTDAILKRTDPTVAGQLYKLLAIFADIARSNEIAFWLCEGSYLGAVRHQGIIPWDDDVDIGLFQDDERKLWRLQDDFRKRGCDLSRWWGGYKVFSKNGLAVKGCKHLYPFLDLLPVKAKRDRIVYARLFARWEWPENYFYREELFPLVERHFGPLTVACPQVPEGYFRRVFGADWNDVAYASYDHSCEKKLKKQKVELVDRSSARYAE